jgi:hypothetical protein
MFLSMLSGIGLTQLLNGRRLPRLVPGVVGVLGVLLMAAALWVRQSSLSTAGNGGWHSIMIAVRDTGESYLSARMYDDPAFVARAGHQAFQTLLVGGGIAVLVAVLVWIARTRRLAVWLLLALAMGELFVFARRSLDRFDIGQIAQLELKTFLEAHPGDYRILNPEHPNAALGLRAREIWGSDPGVPLRYAQLLAATQGIDPDQANQYLRIRRDHPLLGLFRCRFTFAPREGRLAVYERTNCLPQLALVQHYRILHERGEILSALTNTAFNPRAEVILETKPEPEPDPGPAGAAGSVLLADSSTDHLTIEGELPSPAILLITDGYARGWRARALPGSIQARYQVLPADYCLRAIPLTAGKHRLRVEYVPAGFQPGLWVSTASLGVFLVLLATAFRGKAEERKA